MIVDKTIQINVGDTPIGTVYQGETEIWSSIPYTKINYIQSTGTQWLDLGFGAQGGMTCEFQASWINDFGYVIGSHGLREPYGRNGAYYNPQWYAQGWELGYGNYYPSFPGPFEYNTPYVVKFSTVVGRAYIEVDGELLGTDDRDTTITNLNVMAFTNNLGRQSGDTTTKARLYYSKIWDANGNLVRDLIPVLDDNDVPCLYDKINKQLYYNQGSGQFIYG